MLEIPIDIEDIDRFGSPGEDSGTKPEEGIVEVKRGIIQKSNAAMARLSGYRHEEVVDTIFASFFHLDDIPVVESICDLPETPDSVVQKPVVRLIGKNGKPIPVEISVGACGKDRGPAHRIKIRHL
jgi:PAS domain S-box-containing protein